MPVLITLNEEEGFYYTKHFGPVTEEDLIHAYLQFFKGGHWKPELNELVDLSEVDSSLLSADGLTKLSFMIFNQWKAHHVFPKVAMWAPGDKEFEFCRMIEVQAAPGINIRVFRIKEDALSWVCMNHRVQ